MVNVSQALKWAQHQLRSNGIVTDRLDSLVLLEDTTAIARAKLLAEPEMAIKPIDLERFKFRVIKRSKHVPLAYIRGKTEFYGREFQINHHVLEPRPESEAIIEELKSLLNKTDFAIKVIDIGTGSGALIITAKLEYPAIEAFATDISSRCLEVAKTNAERYQAYISFFQGHLLKPLPEKVWQGGMTIILANLPYVPNTWQINPEAMREPKTAIFGGADGLKLYRLLFRQQTDLANPPIWILTEALPPQHPALAEIAERHGYRLSKTNDFVQVFKLIRPHS